MCREDCLVSSPAGGAPSKPSLITTLRGPKVANMAVFDWVATGIGAFALSKVLKLHAATTFIILVALAIVIHHSMGIPTMLNAYLGLSTRDAVITARQSAV